METWVLKEPMDLEPRAVGLLSLGLFSRGYVGVTWFQYTIARFASKGYKSVETKLM